MISLKLLCGIALGGEIGRSAKARLLLGVSVAEAAQSSAHIRRRRSYRLGKSAVRLAVFVALLTLLLLEHRGVSLCIRKLGELIKGDLLRAVLLFKLRYRL